MSEGSNTQDFKSEVAIPQVEGITPAQFNKLGNFLMKGMNESEAALLADIDKKTILWMRRNSEQYNTFVEKKKLEFKRKHLEILSTKSDPRISQWLLERLSPEEFSGKKKSEEVPTNVVAAIIQDIQNENKDTSELSFAYKDKLQNGNGNAQRASRQEATERIRQVLQ